MKTSPREHGVVRQRFDMHPLCTDTAQLKHCDILERLERDLRDGAPS